MLYTRNMLYVYRTQYYASNSFAKLLAETNNSLLKKNTLNKMSLPNITYTKRFALWYYFRKTLGNNICKKFTYKDRDVQDTASEFLIKYPSR